MRRSVVGGPFAGTENIAKISHIRGTGERLTSMGRVPDGMFWPPLSNRPEYRISSPLLHRILTTRQGI